MTVNRKNLFSIIVLIITSIIAIALTVISSSPILHIIGLWSIALVAVIISKFDLLHPYFWFSAFFVLYSSSYSIILLLGHQSNTGYSYENTLMAIVALTTSLIIIGPKSNAIFDSSDQILSVYDDSDQYINRKLLKVLLVILCVILIVLVIMISRLGISRKTEFINNGFISFRLATYVVRFVALYCVLYIVNSKKKYRISFIVLFSGFSSLVFSLYTAERDAIFRFLLVTICALFVTKRIERKKLPIVLALGVISVVSISYLKYFFVSGEVRTGYLDNNLIYNFLNSDFAAAGENMQVLINNPWTNSFHDFSLLFYDLLSPITFGVNQLNIGLWFNNTFYFGESSRAFTLIGQGYVIGGYIGVVLLFSLLAGMTRYIYNRSITNPYWLSIYIFFIATVASSFRGTLGSIMVTIVRIGLFGTLVFLVLRKLIARSKTNGIKDNC